MLQVGSCVKRSQNLTQNRSLILLGIGSNLPSVAGDPRETIIAALQQLEVEGGVIRSRSAFFRTPAFPAGSGPDFVNAAVAVDASWSPEDTLQRLHTIEAKLGRQRSGRWAARTVDLDLLAHGDQVLPDVPTVRQWMDLPAEMQARSAPDGLILPHPRLQDRAFVLGPLRQVAPDWVHPILGKSVEAMWLELSEQARAEVTELR